MIDENGTEDAGRPLHELIRSRMDQYGWSYTDLARRSGNDLSRARWQQLGSGLRQRKFPEPASLTSIAVALDVDLTTVVLSAARSVGLAVRPQGSTLADLLPPGTERLSSPMRDAILSLVRVAVGEIGADVVRTTDAEGTTLEWPKADAPSRHRQRVTPTDDGGSGTG
ncbi:helix-turn-helix transcriptional regulator [Pseudonocardia sp. N23]|uniref:helix-turn-helix domain-containing protein n=1 Tax=Pseudonocardia sp. N23 TaxID=1987376 RepID=UPI000BFCABCC|nr:helix-turn-helix transcriptional regulator [Pseudonocardia sp. N23]GAY09624.1 hypothetical protein TOK_3891 [Pseudonocardia sp. N23]